MFGTSMFSARLKFALKWATGHLLVSAIVVALAAGIVFFLWYPSPWRSLLGVGGIFGLMVVVDLVCGPLLTMVLATPQKSPKERWVDLSLVGLIQITALAYGLWSVHLARPVVLAFEVDRLTIVTANEVQTELLPQAPPGLQLLPWAGVQQVGLRKARTSEEYLASVQLSLGGVTQSMRPNWWTPFDETTVSALLAKTQPLQNLINKKPTQAKLLQAAADKSGKLVGDLRFIPLTSSTESSWVALIDTRGKMLGAAPVDGF